MEDFHQGPDIKDESRKGNTELSFGLRQYALEFPQEERSGPTQ